MIDPVMKLIVHTIAIAQRTILCHLGGLNSRHSRLTTAMIGTPRMKPEVSVHIQYQKRVLVRSVSLSTAQWWPPPLRQSLVARAAPSQRMI